MLSFVARTETYFQLCQESLLLALQLPSLWLVLLWIMALWKYHFMYSFLQVKRIQFFQCVMESFAVRLGLHCTNNEVTDSFCSHWKAKQSWRSPWKGLWNFLPRCLLYHSPLLYISMTEGFDHCRDSPGNEYEYRIFEGCVRCFSSEQFCILLIHCNQIQWW